MIEKTTLKDLETPMVVKYVETSNRVKKLILNEDSV